MNAILEKAKSLLEKGDGRTLSKSGSPTFALVNGGNIYISEEKGIKPLMALLSEKPELLKDASVADKVTGRAAAFLMLHGGVGELYTELISSAAKEVLDEFELPVTFIREVPEIMNRSGTGQCPMEAAVMGVREPEEAYKILYDKLK